MTYVTGGDVVAKRSPWRLSIVTDTFWGVVNFVGLLYVVELQRNACSLVDCMLN